MSIHIISQFLEVVFSNYDTWPNDKKLFFRGHADKDWKLLPSVFRLDQNGKTHDERSLILDYKQVSVSEMDYRGKIENMLVEMQHLGMPTRMLDWSLSPLVALYFACQSNINPKTRKETDGAVYALNPWEAYKRVTEKLAPHPELMDILKESRMLLAQKWELDWIRKFIKQKYGYKLAKEVLRAPVPFVGRYMVDRVASQQSGFVIWG
ncbi:MAG: FRG domain-containing protein, partial [Muribaculaceae bacterium]|nr:FRG domain-containing protein [Muribaculaceae bacterium]